MSDQDRRDEPSPAARWEPAADADNPPWAGRERGEDDEREDAQGSDPGDQQNDQQSDAPDQQGQGGDAQDPEAEVDGSTAAGQTAGGPGAALAELRGKDGPQPPRPPKRTGVFVDPDDLREHVGALLRAMLGGYQVDAWGNYTFSHEDARVFVTVGMSPIGPQVGVFSVTNVEVDLTPQLAGFLLTTNHQLNFGAFSFDAENGAVWLRHSLLGTTLDGPELQSAVAAIASTAAHFDDVIRDRFGGRRFTDAPQDVQDATHPPEPSQEAHPNASGYL